jgi:hypothetical protein
LNEKVDQVRGKLEVQGYVQLADRKIVVFPLDVFAEKKRDKNKDKD